MENLVNLTGKRILVTGASSGIGRACAVLAASLGATVVVTARRESALRETLALLEGSGHSACVADLANADDMVRLVSEVGVMDGLVHAAGVCPRGLIAASDASQWETAFRVNCGAFLELMRHFAKARNRAPSFSAVAVSSVSAAAGWAAGAAYCGAKGAVSAAVRALAVELAPKGVRVNAVCPANVRTPMMAAGLEESGGDEAGLAALQPLGIGEPEHVAAAVAFLLSSAASFITGVNLPVDGGYLAK